MKGNIYKAIKSLYSETWSCIRLSNYIYTDFFLTTTGVRQVDNLSPTLFALFINDLAHELKELGIGVKINELIIPILLSADDVVSLTECEKDFVFKYKVCQSISIFSGNHIEIVSSYNYLGVVFDEHLTFEKCSQVIQNPEVGL